MAPPRDAPEDNKSRLSFADHIVSPLDEKRIEEIVLRWRQVAEEEFGQDYFNIVDFLKKVIQRPKHRGQRLDIKFPTKDSTEVLAKVSFDPLTLHVRADVWAAAQADTPWARWVLAHECGHIILHDDFAKGFSAEAGVPTDDHERSAEWQADRFADFLLMPTKIVERQASPQNLAVRCGVDLDFASRRIEQVSEYWGKNGRQHEGQCSRCFGLSLRRIADQVKCETCQKISALDF